MKLVAKRPRKSIHLRKRTIISLYSPDYNRHYVLIHSLVHGFSTDIEPFLDPFLSVNNLTLQKLRDVSNFSKEFSYFFNSASENVVEYTKTRRGTLAIYFLYSINFFLKYLNSNKKSILFVLGLLLHHPISPDLLRLKVLPKLIRRR